MTSIPKLTGQVLSASATQTPNKTALIYKDFNISFELLECKANRLAHALLATGIPPRSNVGVMSQNCIEYVVLHFGTSRTGHVLVHLSTRYKAGEIKHILKMTGIQLLFLDTPSFHVCKEVLKNFDHPPKIILLDGENQKDEDQFEPFIAGRSEETPNQPMSHNDPFAIQFTGGTTGIPKGAILSHCARLTSGTAAIEDFPLYQNDIAVVPVPLSHAAGLFTWFQPLVQVGATSVLMTRWSASEFIKLTEEHRITAGFMVPAQLAMLLDDPKFSPKKMTSLRFVAYGGAPAPKGLIERAEKALPGVRIVLAYGSTETGHVLCNQPETRKRKPKSLGRPGPHIVMGVFQSPGIETEVGIIGEITTTGEHLMLGYLGSEEQTKEFFRSEDGAGWSGDLGFMDEDGVFTLIGRSKEMIIAGGINIYPIEIETVLEEHPEIYESAVFALTDPVWGELPAAAVVLEPGSKLSCQEIIDYSSVHLADFKRLRFAVLVGSLPKTTGGKIQRKMLADRFKNNLDKSITKLI